jgi:hypothetical protein
LLWHLEEKRLEGQQRRPELGKSNCQTKQGQMTNDFNSILLVSIDLLLGSMGPRTVPLRADRLIRACLWPNMCESSACWPA